MGSTAALFYCNCFDHPFRFVVGLLMCVSTPLLLWLAWALSQPARRLELLLSVSRKACFEIDPEACRKGTSEFSPSREKSFNQMRGSVN